MIPFRSVFKVSVVVVLLCGISQSSIISKICHAGPPIPLSKFEESIGKGTRLFDAVEDHWGSAPRVQGPLGPSVYSGLLDLLKKQKGRIPGNAGRDRINAELLLEDLSKERLNFQTPSRLAPDSPEKVRLESLRREQHGVGRGSKTLPNKSVNEKSSFVRSDTIASSEVADDWPLSRRRPPKGGPGSYRVNVPVKQSASQKLFQRVKSILTSPLFSSELLGKVLSRGSVALDVVEIVNGNYHGLQLALATMEAEEAENTSQRLHTEVLNRIRQMYRENRFRFPEHLDDEEYVVNLALRNFDQGRPILEGLTVSIDELETELVRVKQELVNKRKRLTKLKNDHQAFQGWLDRNRNNDSALIRDLDQQITSATKTLDSLTNQIATTGPEISQLEENVRLLEIEISRLHEQ